MSFIEIIIIHDVSSLPKETDYCVPKLNFNNSYEVIISRIADTIRIYTDGSKLNNRGVYSAEMEIYDSFRLPDHCSVYQAEVTSIQETIMYMGLIKPNTRDINLFSDSQAALKALDSYVDNSKTIIQCRRSLNEMAKHYKITLIRVSGHQDIEGNCIADELARKGATIEIL